MSLRDPKRLPALFQTDDEVRRALEAWSREPDLELARVRLARVFETMSAVQRQALLERLAEIALGQYRALEIEAERVKR